MTGHTLTRLALRSATVGYVLCLIVLPLAGIGWQSFADGWGRFIDDILQPQARAALALTLQAALITTCVNAVFGTLSAWVLVRFDFPGRAFLNALVDLPFAIPTLVAGIMAPPNYKSTDSVATREAFGVALAALGEANPLVVALDADVKNSTFTDKFGKQFPDRFFENFIAEQNMVGASAGLAACGKIPFAATFACFLTRAYDFIRMDFD